VTHVAVQDEKSIRGAVGHKQVGVVVYRPLGYGAGLNPGPKRDRPGRTQTAAKVNADQPQPARNAGYPAGKDRRQRRNRPADVKSRGRRGQWRRTPCGARHYHASADERYGKGGSKERGVSLSFAQSDR
jgi:hypothetical protein